MSVINRDSYFLGQSYVQGMNEIIGPIYYVLAADSDLEWRQHAEADCFFCFTNLMSDIRDFFIKTLDDSSTGIQALMIKLNNRSCCKNLLKH